MTNTCDSRPNPGSSEAKARGCTCPVLDNAHGRGYLGGVKDANGETAFVIAYGCPLHAWPFVKELA